jgi:cobalt-zinc-cadmium efflux system protein
MSAPHPHVHGRDAERRALACALGLVLAFMAVEATVGVLASSLALLSDAAHMLTDALALALSLAAARLAARPARGALTFGLGRAEILSAQANGLTLLALGLLIVYGAVRRLISPVQVAGGPMLAVALCGIAVSLLASRLLHGDGRRSLNVEGSYRHLLTDLFGFAATAAAAIAILAGGLQRADAVASLAIAAVMLSSARGLLAQSARVFMESAPADLDVQRIGQTMASQPGIVEVHDLHVWEVTSGFVALSAHVLVGAGSDCHELRRQLQRVLRESFGIEHTTLQVDHEAALQPPLQIEPQRNPHARPDPGANSRPDPGANALEKL